MNQKRITSPRLKELRAQMANKFEYSFGHNLTDEEREQNWKYYQKLRNQYLSEYQRLTIDERN